MKGVIFCLLTLVLGGVLGIGLEKLAALLPSQMAGALTHVYGVGIHPLAVHITLCGFVGLILGYVIVSKFVKK